MRYRFICPFARALVPVAALFAAACGNDDDGGGIGPPTTGSVEVTASTTGAEPDADGYTVTLGTESMAIGVNETVTFSNVSPGTTNAELGDLSFNCDVTGDNPVSVSVTAGETATAGFDVSCPLPQIAFVSVRQGSQDIYIMNSDGTQLDSLPDGPGFSSFFDWSPDGTQIAFTTFQDLAADAEIHVMNADGSSRGNLTNSAASEDMSPVWSPDGTMIAFQTDRDGDQEVYVMNADGSGLVNLTNNAAFEGLPAWSPDGTQIAFSTNRDGDSEIYVMDADGSNPVNLTNEPGGSDTFAVWSPDGTQILFTTDRDGDDELYVMNADGSNPVNLTNDGGNDLYGQFSPDGLRIAFTTDRDANNEIYVMNADGSDQTNVTNDPAFDFFPRWRP